MSVASQSQPKAPALSVVARVTTLPHLVFGALPVIGYLLGGGIYHWLTLFVYLGLTFIDPLVGNDETNHDPAQEQALENQLFYRGSIKVRPK